MRANFKKSVEQLVLRCALATKHHETPVIAIDYGKPQNTHILLFPKGIRLDISNQTIFVDAAAIALNTKTAARLDCDIRFGGRLCSIVVNDELSMWQRMLPVFAERCRDWPHRAGCSYTGLDVPHSPDTPFNFLCACGTGKFPSKYLPQVSEWSEIAPLATRVAIPLVFPSALRT